VLHRPRRCWSGVQEVIRTPCALVCRITEK
jgi:hypothetical protein